MNNQRHRYIEPSETSVTELFEKTVIFAKILHHRSLTLFKCLNSSNSAT